MEDVSQEGASAIAWLQAHAFTILFWGVLAVLAFRFARPAVHRVLLRVVKVPVTTEDSRIDVEGEVAKRVDTLEDLFAKIIRFALVIAILIVFLSVVDGWPLLAGLGLVAAALTLAGQSIVLDYLSGILLLIEGPYFKGDVVAVGGVQGTVEEVGLRRTIVRDPSGTMHAVANGEIRVASNLTRMYGSAVVDVTGIDVADVDRVSALMNEVGAELAADPAFAASLLETPKFASITAFTDLGATLRMNGRVRPTDRWTVEAELRRRLATAFASADVHPNRRLVAAGVAAGDGRPAG